MSIQRIEVPRVFKPLLAPARYKCARGGRASAKSHFFATKLVMRAVSQPGLRWVCLREVQRSLKESVKRLIEDKISAHGVGSYFEVMHDQIKVHGNGLIIFNGMANHTAESAKSLEGYDGAWFEEAQSASDRSLTILRPTIRKPDSEIWFSYNPHLPTDPVDQLMWGDNPLPEVVTVHATFRDNPWLPDEMRREIEWDRARDPEKYAHVWLGEYIRNSEARVFKNWRVEEFETDPDAEYWHGADWGFSVDPTVLIRCRIDGRKLYVDQEAYKVGCEIDDTPALFDKIEGARGWTIRADSARPETIKYMQKHGYPKIVAARKGPGSVEEGVTFLQSFDIVVHPRCRHTIDELTHYAYKVDAKTGDVLPVLEDRKNHVIDALRYAVEGVRRATPSVKSAPVRGLY